jgi:hypothetical protein
VARGTGPARAYQVRIYGEREPLVSRPGQPRVYADGLNRPYGSLGDAKFRGSASSFYDPSSLHPSIQHLARRQIDNVLLGYKQVLNDPGNPAQALELMTNDPRVARSFAAHAHARRARLRGAQPLGGGVAGDDFALVVVGDTDWAWDLDAVVAAVAATWPQATIHDHYPVQGSTFRAYLDLPDTPGGGVQVALDDSGKLISLRYGSPEATAEFVTWVLGRFPPPDDVTVQLFEWGPHRASPRRPPSRICWPSDPDDRSVTMRSQLGREPGHHRRTAHLVLGRRDGASRARPLSTPATSGPWVPVAFA